ncbi:hypothetical protein [Deinococcus cellulosilyticus]|uniref:Uncharacterized protein n=1 Tax=Deinococcus cellulosilyticus (strain DSM 18568 / NBRC 106333 / KACC 11606 / 5516J-15) TaxID=1223518 RepID=A0A511N4Y9_DEIC1|nr:hypothetical protein [Deinococcus cellulosilyticus]GEM47909.1 hypothetical protein DC3_35440 [Deinococcus cellulosilyticus NBRC 106333 = KACC 11606]
MNKLLMTSAALVLGTSFAAPLAQSVPDDALLTLEVKDLKGALTRMGAFRPVLVKAIQDAVGVSSATALKSEKDVLEFLGTEGVISVHINKKTFQPSVLFVTTTSAGTVAKKLLDSMLASDRKAGKVSTVKEGKYSFYQSTDSVYGFQNNVAYVSSDATTLRAFLRKLGGGAGTSLSASATYKGVMTNVQNSNFKFFLNFSAAGDWLKAFAGTDPLISSAVEAVKTLGQLGAGTSVTAKGLESTTVFFPNKNTKDKALYNLLTYNKASLNAATVVPANVLTFSDGAADLPGFARYLDSWINKVGNSNDPSIPAGAIPELNLTQNTSWLGKEVAMVTLPSASNIKLSNPDPLATLTGTAVVLEVTSADAASKGMQSLLSQLTQSSEQPLDQQTLTVNGSTVNVLKDQDFSAYYTFKNNFMLLAFSEADMRALLAPGLRLSESTPFKNAKFPKGVQSIEFSNKAPLQTRESIRSTLELALASGASEMKPKDQEKLINALVNVTDDLQKRVGGSQGYTQFLNGKMINKSVQFINWK